MDKLIFDKEINQKDLDCEIRKLLQKYTKSRVISLFINNYIERYYTKNVWELKKIYKFLQIIENSRCKDEIVSNFIKFIEYCNKLDYCKISSSLKNIKVDYENIKRIIYLSNREYEIATKYKEYCSVETYALINFIYERIMKGDRLYDMLETILYLSNQKNKDLFIYDNKKDIIEILWEITGKIIINGDDNYINYYKISRNLYYYKLLKKDILISRLNFLIFTIYSLAKKNIVNEEKKDIEERNELNLNNEDKIKYLFQLCKIDENKVYKKPTYKNMIDTENIKKIIEISSEELSNNNNINIIKI